MLELLLLNGELCFLGFLLCFYGCFCYYYPFAIQLLLQASLLCAPLSTLSSLVVRRPLIQCTLLLYYLH